GIRDRTVTGVQTCALPIFGIDPGRGILLLGVQGCGKTMVARAVAREWGLPLLKMEPARLYDKYIGETEKNLDKALRMAEQMAPRSEERRVGKEGRTRWCPE